MSVPAACAIVYDLQDPGAWDEACRHARVWGRLYTDIRTLSSYSFPHRW